MTQSEDVEFFYLDSQHLEAAEIAGKFDVRSVPTVIFTGPGKNHPVGALGTPS